MDHTDYRLTRQVEDAIARELDLSPGTVCWTTLQKPRCSVDIPMLRRDGRVVHLTAEGFEGALNLLIER